MSATILVIEDEPGIQELMAYVLRLAGHRPVCADSAEQAMELMQEEDPDLVILDWMLPGQSGLDFARTLRAEHNTARLPILMVSARAHEEDRARGMGSGVDGYLTKPFSPRELKSLVKETLHQAALAASAAIREGAGRKPLRRWPGFSAAPASVGFVAG